MAVGLKNVERVRLESEQAIKITFSDSYENSYSYLIYADKYLGEGNSSICYEVTVYKNSSGLGQKRVLKQFYPNPKEYQIETEMTGIQLDIKGYSDDLQVSKNPDISRLGRFFEDAFTRQVNLSNEEKLADVIVRPDMGYFHNATKYVLYEPDYGQCLELKKLKSFEEFINKSCELAYALQQIHRYGLLYMDLKPSNILVSSSGKIKLFDFDASIEMGNVENVHIADDGIRYDFTNLNLIAPELRPDSPFMSEFEQNKKFFLNEKIDIYSFGAIMFNYLFDRYPSNEDIKESDDDTLNFESELSELFNGRFRGELTDDEIYLLGNIIWKCIREGVGPNQRYENTDSLVSDLKKLKDDINTPIEKRRRVYNKVNGRLQSACVMDSYPLSGYRKKVGTEYVMESMIIGNDPIGEDFFANIFACSQMLDTKNIIRIAVTSAEEKLAEYIKKYPLLSKTSNIHLNDKSKYSELDKSITNNVPFADIYFYEWKNNEDSEEFISVLDMSKDIPWIVVCDSIVDSNRSLAEKIAAKTSGDAFVAYLDNRGDGFDLRESDVAYNNVKLYPFACNNKYSDEEMVFDKTIKKRAFLLHKYYTREWNERASDAEIKKDFRSEAYNVKSSLSSALSIPYKLQSVGIKTTGSEAAAEYKRNVLDKNNKLAQRNFNRLLYLEHRRWMCFMVTEGYSKPTKIELEQYMFRGKNDQRNKTDKLHPCMCGCGKDNGICLDSLSHEKWENINLDKFHKETGNELDELDRMSIELHRLCNDRISHLNGTGEYDNAMHELEMAMKVEKDLFSENELLDAVKTVSRRMLNNESNINRLWKQVCNSFEKTLKLKNMDSKVHIGEVETAFKNIKNMMRVVEERNKYHDYKSSDRTILEALPLLLLSDNPIRRIYKPVAGNSWNNIASTLLIEPEELYLYTDNEASLEIDLIRSFLEKERGIMDGRFVHVENMSALKKLKVNERSVKGVLDITGLSAEDTYEITHMENLESMPIIVYKNGQIHSVNGETEADYYGYIRRHVSVTEAFDLCHANVHSEDSQNHMLGLASNYENIWKAYLSMNSYRYKLLVGTLNAIEESHYWKLDKLKKSEDVYEYKRKHVPNAMLQDSGIDKLFSELLKDNWIEEGYICPGVGQVGMVTFKTKYHDVVGYFDKIFELMKQHPYMHKFIYQKNHREPMTNRPLTDVFYCIYNDTLLVDEVLEDKIDQNDRYGRNIRINLNAALNAMQKEEGIITECESDSSELIEGVPEKEFFFRMRFVYCSRATKECLMKEGNILEAYVYYAIWKDVLVDDVKLNVTFTWDSDDSSDALEIGAITNEIDLVCTHNMQTYFISCKQSEPKNAYLHEIKYFADHFGIDGKAILITSNWKTGDKQDRNNMKPISERSKKMQVYYIDREMLGESDDMMSKRLAKYIQNIIDSKENWKNIEN